jgi:aspartyl-tRNA synthetase
VVTITGEVAARPEKLRNPNLVSGDVEICAQKIEINNSAETLPFSIEDDGRLIGEELRLQYRYLDMRRARLAKNIRNRHKVFMLVRNFLNEEGFVEVETPLLSKSTPEGSRDYIVPSRIDPGKFYALPQSPQQYKQLLMAGGMEKYFQVARCLRDEDSRGDRQPEFTQLDMEMSFVKREDVMELNERLLIKTVQELYPEKHIQQIPFPRLTYAEAMEKYGNDKPDLREDKNDPNLLAFCWVIDFPFFEKTDEGTWTFTHNPFSAPKPEHVEWLMEGKNIGDILTTQYDVALNGY